MLAEKKYHALAYARATAPQAAIFLLLEAVAILGRIHKPFNHVP